MLTDPSKGVQVKGRFGLKRNIISEDDASQRNLNPSAGLDANNTNTISDHAFGRAFDIDALGSFSNFGKSKEHYASSLHYVLSRLNSLPLQLIPDLIVISPDVAKDLGVGEGFESESTAIKTLYPQLRYVNFESNDHHKDNIHISFSPNRAGQYIGSPGWTSSSTSQDSGSVTALNTEEDKSEARQKAYANYKSGGPEITLNELFLMLTVEGPFSEEVAAVMCAVAARESVGKPSSFNGICSETQSSWGGDYSIGSFQFNLIALMNKLNNISTNVPIYYDGSKVDPKTYPAHELAYAPGKALGWDSNATGKKMVELQNNGKADTDDKLWYPINQVWMLMTKWGRKDFKNESKITTSNGFFAWGDYYNKDGTPRSECGFIFKTKFQDAVNVYLTSGKPIDNLTSWVRSNLPKTNPRTADYIEGWMNGEVYRDKKVDGLLKDEANSKPIVYGQVNTSETSPGSGNENASATFSRTQILDAANWLKANRADQWVKKYRQDLIENGKANIQCDRFARVLSASIGLFGAAETNLTTQPWEGESFTKTIPTATLSNFETAGAHWNHIIDKGTQNKHWYAAESETGKNPPAGYLVFWTGGKDEYGHVGVSVGGGEYVDQHTSGDRPSPRKIDFSTFPGSQYTYAGCSSVWSV